MNKIQHMVKKICEEIPEASTGFNRYFLLADYLYCKYRYHILFEEYRQYEFYHLKHTAKKQYITEHDVLHVIPQLYNNPENIALFRDKRRFNDFFKEYLGREYCEIDGSNYSQFEEFCARHDRIIIKPTNLMCGHGIQSFSINEIKDLRLFYESLVEMHKECLVEEVFQQSEAIASLNPDSVNTMRIISLIDSQGKAHVVGAAIRIGRMGSCIDNFCAGGMAAAIDIKTGMVISMAYDKNSVAYAVHPDTGNTILGFQIPEWDKVVAIVEKAAESVPSARLVGWDAVISKEGKICFIEGNTSPGARTLQMPLKCGLKPIYLRYLGKF